MELVGRGTIESAVASVSNTYVIFRDRKELPWYVIPLIIGFAAIQALILCPCCLLGILLIRKFAKRKQPKDQTDDLSTRLITVHGEEASELPNFNIDKNLFEIPFEKLKGLREIGSGGSGAVVYKATLNNDFVVIKLFRNNLFSDEKDYHRFENEVRLLA